jgi:Zn-dependent membrane protease YugP
MQSNFSQRDYYKSFDICTNQLELMVNLLMPRLHSSWKNTLLEERQSKMTGAEVARTILWHQKRMDVKVCLSQDDQNCYSPLLNWVGLSEDVAGSRSVIAAAIAAHEVGHALQPDFEEKIGRVLKNSPIPYLSFCGEFLMVVHRLLKELKGFDSTSLFKSQAQNQSYSHNYEIHQFRQSLKHRLINPRQHLLHLLPLVITLLKYGYTSLLFLLINFMIIGVVVLFAPLLISCIFICRSLIFLIELHVSWFALRLLKQYKILDIKERKAANKFLIAAALTYLRSCTLNRLLA